MQVCTLNPMQAATRTLNSKTSLTFSNLLGECRAERKLLGLNNYQYYFGGFFNIVIV